MEIQYYEPPVQIIKICLILFSCLIFCYNGSLGQEDHVFSIDTVKIHDNLNDYLFLYEDLDRKETIDAFKDSSFLSKFKPYETFSHPFRRESIFWGKIEIDFSDYLTEDWVFEIGFVDLIGEVFLKKNDSLVSLGMVGWNQKKSNLSIPNDNYGKVLLNRDLLEENPGVMTFYLRLEHYFISPPLNPKLKLIPYDFWLKEINIHQNIQGIFQGAFFTLILFFLINFFVKGGWANLYYSLFVFGFAANLWVSEMFLDSLLFPEYRIIKLLLLTGPAFGVGIFYPYFIRAFLELNEKSLKLDLYLKRLTQLGIGMSIYYFYMIVFECDRNVYPIFMALIHIFLLCNLFFTITYFRKSKDRMAVYIISGAICFILSSILFMVDFNLNPFTIRSAVFVETGIFLEASFLAIGLAHKMRITEKEKTIAEQEKEGLLNLDKAKSQFYANISHEFRTPLSLMNLAAQKIRNINEDTLINKELELILTNSGQLEVLIQDILLLSQIDATEVKLKAAERDIVGFCRDKYSLILPIADQKNIDFEFYSEVDAKMIYFDWNKLEKAISNLLSNALKFTQEGGKVRLTIREEVGNIMIIISDNGIGIPIELKDRIFDRFYQVDNQNTRFYEGVGLGLFIAREMVNIHYGSLEYSLNSPVGSMFTIRLPKGKEHLKASELLTTNKKVRLQKPGFPLSFTKNQNNLPINQAEASDLAKVLVVEDNVNLRESLGEILEENYRVRFAEDGASGMRKAMEEMPDIILADIMMPGSDGYELCKKLKEHPETCHIPLIFITAKAQEVDKLEGLSLGADDYIYKPFKIEELLVRISNLINQRRRLKAYFERHFLIDPQIIRSDIGDSEFLSDCLNLIESNLEDANFGVNELAKSMDLDRTTLSKKISRLSGFPPSQIIVKARLKKAKQLFKYSSYSIKEVSYKCGFNSPAYFSTIFKETFGMTPSEFVKKHTSE